jgi:spore coat protein CotH
MKKLFIATFFSLFIVSSCEGISFEFSLPNQSTQTTQPNQPLDYVNFWAVETKLDVAISISQTNLMAIETYGQEKNGQFNDYYFPATIELTINNQRFVYEEVGLRQKGNIFSRGPFLNENARLQSPFHFRMSFDQTYDEDFYGPLNLQKTWQALDPAYQARKDRRLFGMKTLEFKWNRSNDQSMVNQIFASKLFKHHGVVTPHSTLSMVSLQTENQGHDIGIYTINEAIDDIFIGRHFPRANANGDLYKALYPNELLLGQMATLNSQTNEYEFLTSKVGVENTEEFYHPTYDLKTNRKTSQHTALMNLVKTLGTMNRLPTSEEKITALNRVVDIDKFLMYVAVSYLTGNPDDMRNNMNNTYIYFDSISNQAHFIPYDLDWSLGLTWDDDITEKMAKKSPLSTRNSFDQTIRNPLYWYTILTGQQNEATLYPIIGNYRQTYSELVRQIYLQEPFSIAAYQTLYQTKSQLYQSYSSTIESNSRFLNIDLFATHHNDIIITIPAML